MAVTVRLEDGYRATIQSDDGQKWVADEPVERGGTDGGPEPTEMLLGALGSCIAITVQMYAQRKHWPLEGVDLTLNIERFNKDAYPDYKGETDSAFVHETRMQIAFRGDLTDAQRSRLLEIAGKCPVHRVLTSPNIIVKELVDPAKPPTV